MIVTASNHYQKWSKTNILCGHPQQSAHLASGKRGSWMPAVLDCNLKHDTSSRLGEGGHSMAFGSVPNSLGEFKPRAAATEIYSQSSEAAGFQLISD